MSEDDETIQRIAEWHERVQFRKLADPLQREAWIKASRLIFDPGKRQPCWVCGKFRGITQAHHVIPLISQYDRGFKYPDQTFLWLCPNHHIIAHAFIEADDRSMTSAAFAARGRRRTPLYEDLTDAEFDKMMELMQAAGGGDPI